MEREDCFLIIAVMVVTSSGKEVPMATSVTPMIRSEIPMYLASSLPLLTSRFAPTTMLIAPPINLATLIRTTERSRAAFGEESETAPPSAAAHSAARRAAVL